MDTSPPVGSAPPGPPCAPCAGPPTDCIADLIAIQAQVCALQTNYLDTIQKYGALLSKVQAGTLSINDIASEIDQLQAQINALQTNSCSNIGAATAVDALIACLAGEEKVFTPTAAGQTLVSFLNTLGNLQWQASAASQTIHYLAAPILLYDAANDSTSFAAPVSLPNFPVPPAIAAGATVGVLCKSSSTITGGANILSCNGYQIGGIDGSGSSNQISMGGVDTTFRTGASNVTFVGGNAGTHTGSSFSISIFGYVY